MWLGQHQRWGEEAISCCQPNRSDPIPSSSCLIDLNMERLANSNEVDTVGGPDKLKLDFLFIHSLHPTSSIRKLSTTGYIWQIEWQISFFQVPEEEGTRQSIKLVFYFQNKRQLIFFFLNEKNQNQKVGVDNQVKHLLARRLHKSSLIRFGWQQQEIQLKPKREEENVDKRKQATTARELDGLLVSRSCQER